MSDLTPFEVGQITALRSEGYSLREIAARVRAPDGIAYSAVARCVKRRLEEPAWTGGRREGSGRPRSTSPAQEICSDHNSFSHISSAHDSYESCLQNNES